MRALAVDLAGLALVACLGVIMSASAVGSEGNGGTEQTVTPHPAGAPDLIVSRIWHGQPFGRLCTDPVGLWVVVKNVGTAKAGTSTTFLLIADEDRVSFRSLKTPALQAGEEVDLYAGGGGSEGATYTGVADSNDEVAESDENNNTLQKTIDIWPAADAEIQFKATCTPTLESTSTPAPTWTPTPAPPAGDANCDQSVNSIDAALVLQFDAGLMTSIPCQGAADVNGDGIPSAIDATLILQYVAGIIGSLSS